MNDPKNRSTRRAKFDKAVATAITRGVPKPDPGHPNTQSAERVIDMILGPANPTRLPPTQQMESPSTNVDPPPSTNDGKADGSEPHPSGNKEPHGMSQYEWATRPFPPVNQPASLVMELKAFLKAFALILIGLYVIYIVGHALFGDW